MARWVIRAAVSAAVVAILLRIIPLDTVLDALRRTSIWTWSASVVVFFAGHYLNAIKLRLLLGPAEGLNAACVRAQYAGLVANLSLPGLAGGDLVRAAYLAPLVGVKRVTFASIADRLIDTGTVLMLVIVALPFAGVPPGIARIIEDASLWIAAGVVIAVIAGIVLLRSGRFSNLAAQISEAWTALITRRPALLGAVVISLVVQSAFVMTNVWLARQVGVTTEVPAWFVAWPLSKLIAVLPISLGGIGVREAALVSLLAPYGAPREAVLASGILWQAVLIVTGVAGLIVTQMLPRSTPTTVAPK
ncbi:MAG: flippase-like domain-containing protein [Acidobacteria bacterium]|nr:flippase-like domain-containing protein [Acidobacteriota bacterium]